MRITRYRARKMRKAPTKAETTVWRWLRGRRFAHLKFRRQHLFGPYILDFYCVQYRLAIELDGSVHADADQEWRDRRRDAYLTRHGITVLRIRNEEVRDAPTFVADRILAVVATLTC